MKRFSAKQKRQQVKKAQKGHGIWSKRIPTRRNAGVAVSGHHDRPRGDHDATQMTSGGYWQTSSL